MSTKQIFDAFYQNNTEMQQQMQELCEQDHTDMLNTFPAFVVSSSKLLRSEGFNDFQLAVQKLNEFVVLTELVGNDLETPPLIYTKNEWIDCFDNLADAKAAIDVIYY